MLKLPKIAGIVSEYNPFHNGHRYHIEKTREITGCDAVLTVMSGNFAQRGEPCICDKYKRAKMALMGGIDLVIELPAVYAVSSAEIFAKGAVEILENAGCDFLSFGAENDDLKKLCEIAGILKSDELNTLVIEKLKDGKSYPRALSEAMGENGFSDILESPNNILAVEYIKAIKNMTPVAVKRKGSMHDQTGSASDIRERKSNNVSYKDLVPDFSYSLLKETKIPDKKIFESLILYKLRTMTKEELKNTPDVSEGLENRIKKAVLKCTSFDELCEEIKTKRYTMARISRILTNALLHIKKDDIKKPPEYLRILGMNETGMSILSEIKKTSEIPIIIKTADAKMCDMLKTDILASDIYSVLTNTTASSDFLNSPIVIK